MILTKAKIHLPVCGNVLVLMKEERSPRCSKSHPSADELFGKHQEHIYRVDKDPEGPQQPIDHLATPLPSHHKDLAFPPTATLELVLAPNAVVSKAGGDERSIMANSICRD